MINLQDQNTIAQIEKLCEIYYFRAAVKIKARTRAKQDLQEKILVFSKGKIIYADSTLTTPQSFAKELGEKLRATRFIEAAIKMVKSNKQNVDSFQELLGLLTRFGICKWEEIAEYIQTNIIFTIEQLVNYSVTFEQDPDFNFDLHHETIGLSWQEIKAKLDLRKQKWQQLEAIIPHMAAIPQVVTEKGKQISSISIRKHCQEWIDGKRSLLEIAEQTHQDPLQLATEYYDWAKQGWIYFGDKPQKLTLKAAAPESSETELPIILSVDDSPVVQTMIKRAIGDRYQVILASNGVDALKILNSSKKIELMLLDVTMPDVDGLEVCRTIRRFKKFKDLPVIMLTAKDGMFDKFKGQFAGSTEYLTKPVDKATLLETIQKYVPAQVSFSS